MTTIRPMLVEDLFRFNNVNLDHWTETFNMSFCKNYLRQDPFGGAAAADAVPVRPQPRGRALLGRPERGSGPLGAEAIDEMNFNMMEMNVNKFASFEEA